jgi:anthranilate synthase component 1
MRTTVVRHPLGRWVDPAAAVSALYNDSPNAFWLDSGVGATEGKSYCGASSRVLSVDAGADPREAFAEVAAELAAPNLADSAGVAALGWVGWLGYDLRAMTMAPAMANTMAPAMATTTGLTTALPLGEVTAPARSRYPDAALLFVDRCVEFDHTTQEVSLVALGDAWAGELLTWRDATVAALENALPLPRPAVSPVLGATARPTTWSAPGPRVTWRDTDAQYLAKIAECQAAIVAGDAYQLCLTTQAEVDVHPDPLRTYLKLRASSPTHHGAFLRVGDVSLLSASPEQFISVTASGVIESRPIKGTRKRGRDATEDAALRDELEGNEKERAENLMIVDLMRNDIGKVSQVGSVRVPSLLAVETYAHVHQLVSRVQAQLLPGITGLEAALACFPAGSMTGAPKLSATVILDRLEQGARGIYAGAFGRFGVDGSVDLAMVIRSIIIDAAGVTIGSGGGITADSVPSEELAEVKLKAAALLAVLGA